MLARLRLLGFILYPGVQNTTLVTQETDQNYSPFKQQFTTNLELITQHRLNHKLSCSFQPWLIVLIVFGGCDLLTPNSDFELSKSAVEEGFNKKPCLRAWEKDGAAPVTRKCLESDNVCKEFVDKEDK